jgi:hypothetical protein
MSRLFQSETTGAAVYVFADDHCPPHVHARYRGEDWVARVTFSFVYDVVALMSIAPLRNMPTQRTVNGLLDDVRARVADCRRSWWTVRRTTCLANQWVVTRSGDAIDIATARSAGAKQIATAIYDPETQRLGVIFHDKTRLELQIGP